MSLRWKSVGWAIALVGVAAYAIAEGAFCVTHHETREACEDHEGFCSPFAWNYRIYYTADYECCYNGNGGFTHKRIVRGSIPTPPNPNKCCTNLVSVSYTDGQWVLLCPQYETPPGEN